ncbi:hypothetical protein N7510_010518 [Penicillium lagena]|uniref:uncharacterized protein n=1 Tax=Penicillium lagena TaxID=94218 RepID=UPI002541A892|nr:uncharacterized protein N7510_010518 [Penicillium lagena]KAJ5605364.1 hypothetical protein N7510_010518 [Penicillium lagena]
MSQEPAATPPPGVVPNLVNPSSNVHAWVSVTQYLCIPVVTIFVVLRMYVKILLHEFYFEDYLGNYIVRTHVSKCCLWWWIPPMGRTPKGLDLTLQGKETKKNISIGPNSNLGIVIQLDYIQMVIYGPLILAIKLSILSMLARFFDPYRQWVLFIYAFSGFLSAYTIAVTTAKICICHPINAVWYGVSVTHGTCLRQPDIFITDATINVITDLIILILPIVLISKLNMPLKKKLKVIVVLAAGGLVCSVTIVRLAWVIVYRDTADRTWSTKRLDLITNPEIALGIICACLPALAALVKRARSEFRKLLPTSLRHQFRIVSKEKLRSDI